jgi:hypothetical protein
MEEIFDARDAFNSWRVIFGETQPPKTEKRSLEILAPLNRLKTAISCLSISHPLPFALFPAQHSGGRLFLSGSDGATF